VNAIGPEKGESERGGEGGRRQSRFSLKMSSHRKTGLTQEERGSGK